MSTQTLGSSVPQQLLTLILSMRTTKSKSLWLFQLISNPRVVPLIWFVFLIVYLLVLTRFKQIVTSLIFRFPVSYSLFYKKKSQFGSQLLSFAIKITRIKKLNLFRLRKMRSTTCKMFTTMRLLVNQITRMQSLLVT